jgi:hypothetical protein
MAGGPWENSVFFVVIISGGAGSGLFVYSPTVGPGNLVGSWAGVGGTDAFGNAYPAGFSTGVAGVGQTNIDNAGNVGLMAADGNNLIRLNPNQQRQVFYSDPPGLGAVLVSIAAKASVDQFGNAIPQGIQINQGIFAGSDFVITTAGAFFYSGTPAFGNLLASIAPAAGTDTHGNAYLAGETSYGDIGFGLSAMQSSGGILTIYSAATEAGPWTQQATFGYRGDTGALFLQGGANLVLGTAGIIQAQNSLQIGAGQALQLPTGDAAEQVEATLAASAGAGAARTLRAILRSPKVAAQQDAANVRLVSSAANASGTAGGTLEYEDTTGTDNPYATWGVNGVALLAAAATAADPTHANTAASPAIAETPKTISWPAGISVNQSQFRLLPDGTVRVDVELTAFPGTANNYTATTTLPAAYRPSVQQRLAASLNGTLSTTTAPAIRFATSGVVQITGLPSAAYNDLLSLHGSYSL